MKIVVISVCHLKARGTFRDCVPITSNLVLIVDLIVCLVIACLGPLISDEGQKVKYDTFIAVDSFSGFLACYPLSQQK